MLTLERQRCHRMVRGPCDAAGEAFVDRAGLGGSADGSEVAREAHGASDGGRGADTPLGRRRSAFFSLGLGGSKVARLIVVWVLLMNTKNAYSDEEMRIFQDIDFDAESVKRLEERLKWLRRVSDG